MFRHSARLSWIGKPLEASLGTVIHWELFQLCNLMLLMAVKLTSVTRFSLIATQEKR